MFFIGLNMSEENPETYEKWSDYSALHLDLGARLFFMWLPWKLIL